MRHEESPSKETYSPYAAKVLVLMHPLLWLQTQSPCIHQAQNQDTLLQYHPLQNISPQLSLQKASLPARIVNQARHGTQPSNCQVKHHLPKKPQDHSHENANHQNNPTTQKSTHRRIHCPTERNSTENSS